MRRLLLITWLLLFPAAWCETNVFFSPDDNVTSHLVDAIETAQLRIYVAIYMLTDKKIATALVEAKKRGVDVQVVADRISAESAYGKCELLAENQIPVYLFEPPAEKTHKTKDTQTDHEKQNELWESEAIMHNKFAVIDHRLWTGSFNWTVKANKKNEENAILTTDPTIVRRYRTRFDQLKERSKRFILPTLAPETPHDVVAAT